MLLLASTHLAADSYEEKQAIEYWIEAKKLLDEAQKLLDGKRPKIAKNKFEKADRKLSKALYYVGEDRKVCLKEKKMIMIPKGRGLKKEAVYITKCYDYDAKRLLKEVRRRDPPKIIVIAQLINQQGREYLSAGERAIIKLGFQNLGGSRSSRLISSCYSDNQRCISIRPSRGEIDEIEPNTDNDTDKNHASLIFHLKASFNCHRGKVYISLNFEEEFGFSPNPIILPLDIL